MGDGYLAIASDQDVVVSNDIKMLAVALMGKGYTKNDLQFTSLKSIVQLENSTSNYTLQFSNSAGTPVMPAERYLDMNDSFAFTMIRMSLAKAKMNNEKPLLSAAKWVTFVDKSVFTAAAGTGAVLTEAEQLCQFFNTELSIETKGVPVVKEFPTNLLTFAPIGNSVATATNATGINGELHGFQRLCKRVLWDGGKSNEIKINLMGDALTDNLEGADGTENYLCIELLGFKINNGSKNDITGGILNDDNCHANFGLV